MLDYLRKLSPLTRFIILFLFLILALVSYLTLNSYNNYFGTRKLIWDFASDEYTVKAGPLISGNNLFFRTETADGTSDYIYSLNATTGKRNWKVKIDNTSVYYSDLRISGQTLYSNAGSSLEALDSVTGNVLWKFKGSKSQSYENRSFTTLGNDTIYFLAGENILYAIDRTTGIEKWEFTAKSIETEPTIVADNTVYLNGDVLYAINSSTGKELWTFDPGGAFSSQVKGGVAYLKTDSNKLVALDAKTGKENWEFQLVSGKNSYKPVIDSDTIYLRAENTYYAISADSGSEKWTKQVSQSYYSGDLSVAGNVVYLGDGNYLKAIDSSSGQEKWSSQLGYGGVTTPPIIKGNTAYFLGVDSHFIDIDVNALYAVDLKTGKLDWKFTESLDDNSTPIIANDILYISGFGGHVFAVRKV